MRHIREISLQVYKNHPYLWRVIPYSWICKTAVQVSRVCFKASRVQLVSNCHLKKDILGRRTAPSRTNQSWGSLEECSWHLIHFAIWPCLGVGYIFPPSFQSSDTFSFFTVAYDVHSEGAAELPPAGPKSSIHHRNVLYWLEKDLPMWLALIKKRQVNNTVFNCGDADLPTPDSVRASTKLISLTYLPESIDDEYS